MLTDDYAVETDGRTVWVNAPICVARFCPISAEIMPADGRTSELRAVRGADARAAWEWFRERVAAMFEIALVEQHAPAWMTENTT